MDKNELEKMIAQRMSMRLMAEATGRSVGSIRYWLNKYELKTSYEPLVLNMEKVIDAAKNSTSLCEMIKRLDMTVCASTYKRIRTFIAEHGIDVSHFSPRSNQNARSVSNEELFSNNKKHSFTTVKNRIIQDGLIPMDRCAICGMKPFWNGKPLTFRLDHINGNHYDNRLENLRFICANCDSQLDTFCHKNRHNA